MDLSELAAICESKAEHELSLSKNPNLNPFEQVGASAKAVAYKDIEVIIWAEITKRAQVGTIR